MLLLARLDLFDLVREYPFTCLVLFHEQAPDARKKARDAFDAAGTPRFHLLERSHKHFVATKCVRAVLIDHVVGVNDVAARLRHFLVVLAEDDSLVHQPLEWLWFRDVTQIE